MAKLQEAWPDAARQRSIQTRQQQAQLKKTGLYVERATGDTVPFFSGRGGFADKDTPLASGPIIDQKEK